MLSLLAPRKPAPLHAMRGAAGRTCLRPKAFGNALGESIVGEMQGRGRVAALDESSRQEAAKRWESRSPSSVDVWMADADEKFAAARNAPPVLLAQATVGGVTVFPSGDRFFSDAEDAETVNERAARGAARERLMSPDQVAARREALGNGLRVGLAREGQLRLSLDEQEAFAKAEAEKRQGWGGVLRGLNQTGVDAVWALPNLYKSVRDYGLFGTGEMMLGGLEQLPGQLWGAAQSGDMQTLTAASAGFLIGPKGLRTGVGEGLAVAERSAVQLGEGTAVRGLGLTEGSELGPVLFGQRRVGPTFGLEGRPSYLAGREISAVADDLRAGVLHPDQLPLDAFYYNGKLVSANTRSLSALSEAGLEPTKINLIEPSRALLRRLGEDPVLPNAPLPGARVPVTPTQKDLTILRVIEIPRPGQ